MQLLLYWNDMSSQKHALCIHFDDLPRKRPILHVKNIRVVKVLLSRRNACEKDGGNKNIMTVIDNHFPFFRSLSQQWAGNNRIVSSDSSRMQIDAESISRAACKVSNKIFLPRDAAAIISPPILLAKNYILRSVMLNNKTVGIMHANKITL